MTSCLSQAACVRAHLARKFHRLISRLFDLAPPATEVPESDPDLWPQYIVYLDEDGAFHLLDVDSGIERDGWRVAEVDSTYLQHLGFTSSEAQVLALVHLS